jgi:hypothetical protein
MIRANVSFEEYSKMPAVSITRLKELGRSPLHYRFRLDNPKESAAMSLGTAAHMATLEPMRFTTEVAVWTQRTESGSMSPRRGKAWESFQDEHKGKLLLSPSEHELAQDIASAVRGHEIARQYLSDGSPEVSMIWETVLADQTVVPCKGRADWLTELDGRPHLVGLKTARDCRPFQFGAAAARYGYHLQWAFYTDGFQALTGTLPRVIEIVVESDPPHAVVVYEIPEDVLEQGRDEYLRLLDVLVECERTGRWPGPAPEREQVLTLPSWVYGSEDDISELGLEAA